MTKIMVVDDEPDLREMINLLLHKEGFETKTAENGIKFLEKLDKFKPDIVILSMMMSGLSTSEIFEKLKDKKCNPKIILLNIVNYSTAEKNRICQLGNIHDFVLKPIKFDYLINCIHECILESIVPS